MTTIAISICDRQMLIASIKALWVGEVGRRAFAIHDLREQPYRNVIAVLPARLCSVRPTMAISGSV